jgi:phage terminase large subunit-like protein
MNSKKDKRELIRLQAESDLESFIKLVHPQRVLGAVHSELIRWWTRQDAKSHQLTLLPRDHGKSAMIAYRVAWEITKNPAIRVLYISSTANLAEKQLKFIKDILTSDIYRFYWPEMLHPEEGKREKWTNTEFSVDHPKRRAEAIRDPTVFIGGLTTTITGLHCDIAVLDDVVIRENAYTEDGREKVKSQYSLLSSIEAGDAREWAVGTRYHPKDLYNDLVSMQVDQYNEDGEIIDQEPLYEVFERRVENRGDGTGEFLWPRQQRYDGKWFGFDQSILAKKRAQYLDRTQFRAQYYNDPNSAESATISRDSFQYYERTYLNRQGGKWFYKGNRLNVFAAVDFAFSLRKRSDYTAIVVVGVDASNNYYVLDIERFKTDKISEYFDRILRLHQKWDFRKIRAEVTSAQKVIVQDLKTNYIRAHGLALSIEEFTPTRHMGTKEERVEAVLQARYNNGQIWHYVGGNCQVLEEELVVQNPPHDDVKDCLASVIDSAVAPSPMAGRLGLVRESFSTRNSHSKFGGIS